MLIKLTDKYNGMTNRLINDSGYGVRSILKGVQIFRDTNTVVDPVRFFFKTIVVDEQPCKHTKV